MAKKNNTKRKIIALVSDLTKHRTYVTRKNTMNTPDKLVLRKYDPIARRHATYSVLHQFFTHYFIWVTFLNGCH